MRTLGWLLVSIGIIAILTAIVFTYIAIWTVDPGDHFKLSAVTGLFIGLIVGGSGLYFLDEY